MRSRFEILLGTDRVDKRLHSYSSRILPAMCHLCNTWRRPRSQPNCWMPSMLVSQMEAWTVPDADAGPTDERSLHFPRTEA